MDRKLWIRAFLAPFVCVTVLGEVACADAPGAPGGAGGSETTLSTSSHSTGSFTSSAQMAAATTTTGATTTSTSAAATTTTGASTTSSSDSSSSSSGMCSPTGDETCAGTADEDCDGTECGLWGRLYGHGSPYDARSLEQAPNGDIYVTGALGSGIVFDGATVVPDALHDQFLAKVSPSGQELWIKLLPSGDGNSYFRIVGVTDDRVIVVGGLNSSSFDLGGGTLSSDGWGDEAYASFSSDGVYEWSKALTAPGDLWANATTHGISTTLNELVLVGFAPAGAVYDGVTFTDPTSTEDRNWYGVAIDAATGAMIWHRNFEVVEGENSDAISSLAFDASGDLYITGSTWTPVSFGGPPIPEGDWPMGFVAHLDIDGNWVDGGRIADGTDPDQIAIGPGGEIIVSSYLDFYQFMGAPVPFQPAQVVMRLGSNYQPVWAQFMNETAGIAVSTDGVSFVLGNDWDTEIAGTTLPLQGTNDVVAGKIGMNGAMKWYRQFGAPGADVDTAYYPSDGFRVGPDGRMVILLEVSGAPVDFGFGPFAAGSGSAIGIVQLAP